MRGFSGLCDITNVKQALKLWLLELTDWLEMQSIVTEMIKLNFSRLEDQHFHALRGTLIWTKGLKRLLDDK